MQPTGSRSGSPNRDVLIAADQPGELVYAVVTHLPIINFALTYFLPGTAHPGTAHSDAQASHRFSNSNEASVQRASQLFLQQVEDSRRKYAFEVEELKVCSALAWQYSHAPFACYRTQLYSI